MKSKALLHVKCRASPPCPVMNEGNLRLTGTGRLTDYPRAVVLYFNRSPTEDELRFIHDELAELAPSAPHRTKSMLEKEG